MILVMPDLNALGVAARVCEGDEGDHVGAGALTICFREFGGTAERFTAWRENGFRAGVYMQGTALERDFDIELVMDADGVACDVLSIERKHLSDDAVWQPPTMADPDYYTPLPVFGGDGPIGTEIHAGSDGYNSDGSFGARNSFVSRGSQESSYGNFLLEEWEDYMY